MGRARGRARRPTRGRGKRDGRSLAGPEKSAHIGNVIPYATRRRPATPGRDGAVVVWRRIFPEGGSMPRASLVSPPVVPLLSRSRTTTMNNVRIPTMRASTARHLFGAAAVALLCALAPAAVHAQTVSGRVTDAAGKAVAGAQVTVAGSDVRATSDAEGRYRLTLRAAGALAVRVTAIGYTPQSKAVTVAAGESATVDFTLTANPVGLDAIIVTASGEQQRLRTQPTDVSHINVENTPKTAITNFADLLNARAAGVTVMPSSGTTGGGARVRIRGSNSVSLSNEPVFFIDGIRVNSGATGNASNTVGVGGQNPSRINDIQVEDLEAIEAVKGPSAGTLYGTAAANGIVQVRTKRGRPGPTQWTAYVEGGTLYDNTTWPDTYYGFDTTKASNSSLRFFCTLSRVAIGQCAQNGGVFTLNPLRDDSPFRTGSR